MSEKGKEVAKKASSDLAVPQELMAFGNGFEGMEASDFSLPYLRLLQATSPEINGSPEQVVKGATPGQFCNSVSKGLYGDEINLIPLKVNFVVNEWDDQRFIAKHKLEESKKLRSHNEGLKWFTEDDHALVDTYEIYVISPEHFSDGVMMFSLKTTNLKHVRKWNSQALKICEDRKIPRHATIWKFKTVYNSDGDNSWYEVGKKSTPAISYVGDILDDPKLIEAVVKFKKMLDDQDLSKVADSGEPNPQVDDVVQKTDGPDPF